MSFDLGPLVDAKTEYQNQLNNMLVKPMYNFFKEMYNTISQNTPGIERENIFSEFQNTLELIPEMNASDVTEAKNKIISDEKTFSHILTALLIIKTKIMTSVRCDSAEKNIDLKVPSTDHFVHHLLTTAAVNLFNMPLLFLGEITEVTPDTISCYRELLSLLQLSICETVDFFVPTKNILEQYIGDFISAPQGLGKSSPVAEPAPAPAPDVPVLPAAAVAAPIAAATIPPRPPSPPPVQHYPPAPVPSELPPVAEQEEEQEPNYFKTIPEESTRDAAEEAPEVPSAHEKSEITWDDEDEDYTEAGTESVDTKSIQLNPQVRNHSVASEMN